jgi:hypothetical protein
VRPWCGQRQLCILPQAHNPTPAQNDRSICCVRSLVKPQMYELILKLPNLVYGIGPYSAARNTVAGAAVPDERALV